MHVAPGEHERQFGAADQEWFAAFSGDSNPIHVDATYARRSIMGDAVVHGVHAVLWALDTYFREGADGRHMAPTGVRVHFRKPIYLNEPVALDIGEGETPTLLIRAGVVPLMVIDLTAPTGDPPRVDAAPESAWSTTARPLTPEGLRDCTARHPLTGIQLAARAFPDATRVLGAPAVASLAACSRIVGMECPGRQSLFASMALWFRRDAVDGPVIYRVRRSEPIIAPVQIEVNAPGVAGTIAAFYRPLPVDQPSFAAVRAVVRPGEFSAQRALVIGGSRGLGELTAKIVAAGGGQVCITYHSGAADAQRVCDELNATGAACTMARFDVLDDADPFAGWPAHLGAPTHAYYFATPRISQRRQRAIEPERLRFFETYYVDGFVRLHAAVAARHSGDRPINLFYPSTVFIDQLSPDNVEYAAAKAAGEVVCRQLDAAHPAVHIRVKRLPRMMTDQTAAIVRPQTEDALAYMLGVIREFSGDAGC